MQQLPTSTWTAIGGGQRSVASAPAVAAWQWIDPEDPVQFSNPWAASLPINRPADPT